MRTDAWVGAGFAVGLAFAGLARGAAAHCDTLDGPVVKDAATALASGDLTPALKWVRAADEREVREVFDQARLVRGQGPAARALADRLFFETLVRVHRAGEGAPFTGLKPAGEVAPGVAQADRAIEAGSVEALAARLAQEIDQAVRRRFARVAETRRHAGESLAAGRAFVAAYVDFVHFVERLSAVTPATEDAAAAGAGPHVHEH